MGERCKRKTQCLRRNFNIVVHTGKLNCAEFLVSKLRPGPLKFEALFGRTPRTYLRPALVVAHANLVKLF